VAGSTGAEQAPDAAIRLPPALEGVSQWPVWQGAAEQARAEVVLECRYGDSDFSQRVLITPTHKLCFYSHRPFGELYDTAADPDQVRNLWDRPEAARLQRELTARLLSCVMNKAHPTLTHSQQAAYE
jgi:hypothetical protein